MKWKLSLLIALLTLSGSGTLAADSKVQYPDSDMKDLPKVVVERIEKMRAMLSKNWKCFVAIERVPEEFFKMKTDRRFESPMEQRWLPHMPVCISNIKYASGTLDEVEGCALVHYDFKTGDNLPYANMKLFPKVPIVSKNCEDGGFDKLMALRATLSLDLPEDSTVDEELFVSHSKAADQDYRFILIYAENEQYLRWFLDARERGKGRTQKLRHKKEKNEQWFPRHPEDPPNG
jgi:hypothetical protein